MEETAVPVSIDMACAAFTTESAVAELGALQERLTHEAELLGRLLRSAYPEWSTAAAAAGETFSLPATPTPCLLSAHGSGGGGGNLSHQQAKQSGFLSEGVVLPETLASSGTSLKTLPFNVQARTPSKSAGLSTCCTSSSLCLPSPREFPQQHSSAAAHQPQASPRDSNPDSCWDSSSPAERYGYMLEDSPRYNNGYSSNNNNNNSNNNVGRFGSNVVSGNPIPRLGLGLVPPGQALDAPFKVSSMGSSAFTLSSPREEESYCEHSCNESVDLAEMEDRLAQAAAHRAAELDRERTAKAYLQSERCSLVSFVSSNRFEAIVAASVVCNAILIGIDVELGSTDPGADTPLFFYFAQHCFTVFFAAELIMRIKAFGFYQNFIRNGLSWEWFDLAIVITSLLEMITDILYLAGQGNIPMLKGASQLRVGRIVKVTKLIRTFRIQRVIRFVAPLRTLVFSIMVTLKSLMWSMCLLLLIIFVVAVVIVQAVTNYRASVPLDDPLAAELEGYFWNLERAMWTLLQCISGGLSWRDAGVPLVSLSPWMAAIFTIFVCFVYFAVLNVVTGVFCSSAIETTQRTPEVIATAMISNKNSYEKNLRQLFSKLDKDNSGMLTLAEMQEFLKDEVLHAQLAALEIDVSDAWSLFRLLDTDKKGSIGLEEFMQGCMNMKGAAKGIDIASLKTEIRSLSRRFDRLAGNFEDPRKVEERMRARTSLHGFRKQSSTFTTM